MEQQAWSNKERSYGDLPPLSLLREVNAAGGTISGGRCSAAEQKCAL